VTHAADVDAHGSGWMTGTPLHSAASGGHSEVVGVLLEAGASVDARQSGGWTALHSAVNNGDIASVTLLLAAGADAAAVNDEGLSVLAMAEARGDVALVATITGALERG
jgi:ankyrin repeat protein